MCCRKYDPEMWLKNEKMLIFVGTLYGYLVGVASYHMASQLRFIGSMDSLVFVAMTTRNAEGQHLF